MSGATTSSHERNFLLTLRGDGPVNREWLEEQAIRLEDVLIKRGSDLASGYSVTANFELHGWEVDFTVETENLSDAYDRMSQILRIIESEIGFSIEPTETAASATASATVAIPA